MSERTVTGSIESNVGRDALVALLADASQLPAWAPAFADTMVRDGDAWRATKGAREFLVQVAVRADAGTVDYLREVAPGRFGGAYLRVVPRPAGGSVVTMTLPVGDGVDPAGVRATLAAELAALAELAIRPA
jgi:Polyketide cyclase / dehydrase and lipid transport